ncbi:hypothetical protein VM95_07990 [Streptomyces rubellomurinus]|uniref:Uncharacterized protein n=2 Tax=Streptomyces TaxID=1883 RepID=A0A0F2TJ61_STRR3|nr:hypothetical protein VM95_07990 [Streptomyces rubellomurinus]
MTTPGDAGPAVTGVPPAEGGAGPAPGPAAPPAAGSDGPAPDGPPAGDGAGGGSSGDPGGSGSPGGERAAGDPAHDADRDRARATRFAQGMLRHDTVRHAFASIDGDLVAGDKNVFLVGGGRAPLRLVSPLVLEQVRKAFAEPAGWPEVRAAFGRRPLAILRGPAGSGKTTAALRLLLGCSVDRTYHLDRTTDLGALAARLEADAEEGPGEPVGYLVDQPEDRATLDGPLVRALDGALHRAGARLVLTVDQESGLVDPELLGHVIDLPDPPEPAAIVRRHLDWRLGEAVATLLLSRRGVAELINEQLAADGACRAAAELAAALADAAEATASGAPDLDLVREKLARRGEEDFEIWVENLDDPFLRCYAVALAVLNGLPQEDVAAAARGLYRRLGVEDYAVLATADGHLPRVREPYQVPRRRRLARLRAQAVPVRLYSPHGRVPAEGLRFKDPGYPRRLIQHAWTEFPLHSVLLDWLDELVENPSEHVRTHAGVALGVLADRSFQYLLDHKLFGWAGAPEAVRRTAVAHALKVCVQNPELRGRVRNLAAGWLAEASNPLRQATAARVYAVSLGGGEPLVAIDALARLCVVDEDLDIAFAVGDSLSDILTEDGRLAAVVLGRLHTALADHRARYAVLLAFMSVNEQFVVETETLAEAAVMPNWPGLLVQADREPALRAPFVALWRAALNEAHPVHRAVAEVVLQLWARLTEVDPPLREVFVRLVGALADGDRRTATILRRQAVDWSGPHSITPFNRTTAAVTAELDRQESAR